MEVSLGIGRVADKTNWRILLNCTSSAMSIVYRPYEGTHGKLTFFVALRVIVTKKARYTATACVRLFYV